MRSMLNRHRRTALAAATLTMVSWATAAQEGAPEVQVDAPGGTAVRRSVDEYVVPNVALVREDGKTVNFPAELDDGRPVVLNFIYTSCATICPMSSQTFEQLQDELDSLHVAVHLVSISIDPEQDRPAQLRAYAAKFHAGKAWDHYSGTLAAVAAVQRAFNAYRGDKMSHLPLTLLRAAPGKAWVRFDGFAGAEELLAERDSWVPQQASLVAR